jgi:hypothetical protein
MHPAIVETRPAEALAGCRQRPPSAQMPASSAFLPPHLLSFPPYPAPQLSPQTYTWNRQRTAPRAVVQRLSSAADFTGLLRGARVAVVGFTSLRCRACRYAGHAYAKAAAEMHELRLGVACFEVDVADPELHALCLSLGVDAVPMWQVFVRGRSATVRDGADGRCADGAGDVVEVDRIVGPRNVGLIRQSVVDLAIHGFDSSLYEDVSM